MTSRAANSLLAVVLAVLASVGVAGFASATPGTLSTPSAASVLSRTAALSQTAADCGDTSGFTQVDLSSLPREAGDTVEEIKAGGPYPYPEDGGVFSNRERILPDCASGYYHEYTVETPGSGDRGARRFVTGEGGEFYYTDDHYRSFEIVDINA